MVDLSGWLSRPRGQLGARMGHVVEHLYSAAFDQPRRSASPSMRYMIASIPRSGSTYFCIQMWRLGVFGAPMEYLSFQNVPEMIDRLGDGDLVRYWRALQTVRTTPNGVFGFKSFVPDFQRMSERRPDLLPEVASDHVIFLTRRDRLSQAVSYYRAAQTKTWFLGHGGGIRPEYDFDRIARAVRYIAFQRQSWEFLFRRTGITPIRIFYEDVIRDFDGIAAKLSADLGVPLDADRRLDIPGIERQSDAVSAEWKLRYQQDLERRRAGRVAAD